MCTCRRLLLTPLMAIVFAASIAVADDKPAAAAAKPDQAALAEAYAKAAAPGPEHERLKSFAGDWDAEVKTFQPDGSPAAGPPSKGVMHVKMILGDRFVQVNYDGEMDTGGPAGKVPFHGTGLAGYDKGKKKYTSVWMDEMGTGMMITEGTADASGVMTCEGAVTEPLSGIPMKVKEVSREIDKDHRKYELYMTMPDPAAGGGGAIAAAKMIKVLEIAYTRRK